jgi:hypothetical protein
MEQDKELTMAKMDEAALAAKLELGEIILKRGGIKEIASWIRNHRMTAGYKRLCLLLMEVG